LSVICFQVFRVSRKTDKTLSYFHYRKADNPLIISRWNSINYRVAIFSQIFHSAGDIPRSSWNCFVHSSPCTRILSRSISENG